MIRISPAVCLALCLLCLPSQAQPGPAEEERPVFADLPQKATGLLNLAMERLEGIEGWRAKVTTDQSLMALASGMQGEVWVEGNTMARADLGVELTGVGMTNSHRVVMNATGMWAEQSVFDETLVFSVDPPEDAAERHEYLAQLVFATGFTLGRLDPVEYLWWLRRGWDLELVTLDDLNVKGTVHLSGGLKSLMYAREALLLPWSKQQLHQADLYLDQETLFPVRLVVSNSSGRQVLMIAYEDLVIGEIGDGSLFDYVPPEGEKPHDMTENYRELVEKRLRLRNQKTR